MEVILAKRPIVSERGSIFRYRVLLADMPSTEDNGRIGIKIDGIAFPSGFFAAVIAGHYASNATAVLTIPFNCAGVKY